MIRVSEDIRTNIAENKLTILALLDIKSAYSSVSHELLFYILSKNGFDASAIEWIKCFLDNKTQYVDVDGNHSGEIDIKCGLIQGDNLSQTLFSLVINGVVGVIKNCRAHLYADDTAIYIETNPGEILIAIEKINNDINEIDKWIMGNGMQLNPQKTQSIIIGSRHNLFNVMPSKRGLPKINVCSMNIEFSDTVKYLGFIFNSCFTSENQTNSIIKKGEFCFI